jgi:hypothetical protein
MCNKKGFDDKKECGDFLEMFQVERIMFPIFE